MQVLRRGVLCECPGCPAAFQPEVGVAPLVRYALRLESESELTGMDVFISWAGARSHAAARALKDWLPMVINAVKPWLSSADIDSGARWAAEVAGTLEKAKFGIICLTPKSLKSEWVIFEAGALSKSLTGTYVCPLLIDLPLSEITGPLAQFQARKADKDGIRKLVDTMNAALGDTRIADAQIAKSVELLWPVLEKDLSGLPSDGEVAKPPREIRDMVEEILNLVRGSAIPPTFHGDRQQPFFQSELSALTSTVSPPSKEEELEDKAAYQAITSALRFVKNPIKLKTITIKKERASPYRAKPVRYIIEVSDLNQELIRLYVNGKTPEEIEADAIGALREAGLTATF